jgi:hypothetical protein
MKETCRLTAPFGEVTLGVGASGDPGFTTEVKYGSAYPALPEGMRVDECRQAFCTLTPLPRGIVAFRMAYALQPDFTASPSSGQWLTAYEIEGSKIIGAIGMHDAEWFEAQPGVADVEYRESESYAMRLRTEGARSLTIGIAVAWKHGPNEWGDVSPWFAVDYALYSNRKPKCPKS